MEVFILKSSKKLYVCTECNYRTSKWMGRCPSCQAWNTLVETEEAAEQPKTASTRIASRPVSYPADYDEHAAPFDDSDLPDYIRTLTGMKELDRVLGGGIVNGSVILLAGEPGIGKSTLLMQISGALGDSNRVLYVSGEESRAQLKMRAQRLGTGGDNLYVYTSPEIDRILSEAERVKPDILIVDSIQTIYTPDVASAPGSVSQVREAAARFIYRAKNDGMAVILVGHVTKEGGIAGPKILEHMVDAVLYFEGEKLNAYRIIRAVKNRFGSTNEIGVFEMTASGLAEVPNPSEMLLAGRPQNVSGNCAVCVMEGTRPIIAEIQALCCGTVFPSPRRTSNGIDYNRLYLLLAVLEKRLGLRFSTQDIYMNVIGGLYLSEPAADMAAAMALISGLLDLPLPDDLITFGEIGLAGECRAVSSISQRIHEAARLGFRHIIIPARNLEPNFKCPDAEIIPVKSIYEMLRYIKK